jgi:hypothetical protein
MIKLIGFCMKKSGLKYTKKPVLMSVVMHFKKL